MLVRGGRLEVFGRRRRPCFYMHNLNNPTPFMVDDDGSRLLFLDFNLADDVDDEFDGSRPDDKIQSSLVPIDGANDEVVPLTMSNVMDLGFGKGDD